MDMFSPDFGDVLRDLMGYNGIQKDILWEIHSLQWKISILSWVNPFLNEQFPMALLNS